MRLFLLALLSTMVASLSVAQKLMIPDDTDKKAVKNYEKGLEYLANREPQEAIKAFDKALERAPDFTAAYIMRGSVHYNLNDYESAEPDFLKVVNDQTGFPPKVYFTVGMIEWKLDKFAEADRYFSKFLTFEGQDESLVRKASKLQEQSAFAAIAMANPLPFDPQSLGENINTEVNEYLPSITADGNMMVFTRRIGRSEFLFYSVKENGKWGPAQSIDAINTYMESGAHTISADGKLIVFTSCEREDGYGSCDLYYTRLREGEWIPPRNLGPRVNSAAWDSQPSLTDNGQTLYFASNRQGTLGSKDIWVTRRLPNGSWSLPQNLGPDINTSGDEKAPFIHFDATTLYFMSNAHVGLGDFDLFITKRNNDTSWTAPQNVGYPLNTKFHDGTLSIDILGDKGYITSDRHHKKELNKGNRTNSETDLYVFDIPQQIKPNPSTFMVIKVIEKSSGQNLVANVNVLDAQSQKVIFNGATDDEGEILVVLPFDKNYSIQVSKKGYAFFSERIELSGIHSLEEPYKYTIELWKPETEVTIPVVLKNILFKTGSDELQSSSETEISYLYNFLKDNQDIFIEIRGHTDNVGRPENNLALSAARAASVKKALVDQGIDSGRIETVGLGETQPIADNETDEGRRLNRRTEFIIKKK